MDCGVSVEPLLTQHKLIPCVFFALFICCISSVFYPNRLLDLVYFFLVTFTFFSSFFVILYKHYLKSFGSTWRLLTIFLQKSFLNQNYFIGLPSSHYKINRKFKLRNQKMRTKSTVISNYVSFGKACMIWKLKNSFSS